MHRCTWARCKEVQLCHHHLQCHSLRTERADLYQMFPTTKDSCTVNRTFICNHRPSPPQQRGMVSLRMALWNIQWLSVTASVMQNGLESKELFTSDAVEKDPVH